MVDFCRGIFEILTDFRLLDCVLENGCLVYCAFKLGTRAALVEGLRELLVLEDFSAREDGAGLGNAY